MEDFISSVKNVLFVLVVCIFTIVGCIFTVVALTYVFSALVGFIEDNFTNIVLPLLSASIGGAFVLIGVWYNERQIRERNEKATKTQTDNFLQGIKDEVTIFWEFYSQNSSILFEETAKDELFTFYNNNSTLILNVESDDLRKSILKFYIRAKERLADYKFHIKPQMYYKHAQRMSSEEQIDIFYRSILNGKVQSYNNDSKKERNDLKKALDTLIVLIDKSLPAPEDKVIEIEAVKSHMASKV